MSPAQATLLQSVTVVSVGTGYYFFELIGGRGEPLEASWGDDSSRLRIQPQRVFIQSAASNHYPEIVLSAHTAEPPLAPSSIPLQISGTWKVQMTKRVVVWSSDAYPADEPPLRLPAAPSDRYAMRVAAGHAERAQDDLDQFADDYYTEHGEAAVGLERFVIDFWPAG